MSNTGGAIKAYKVFNPDWTCRGMQYEVGKTYELDGEPKLCKRGFHACVNVADCFNYYKFDCENKVAEVELSGTVLGLDGDKQCCNRITIVRELTWARVLELANTGKGNSGLGNTGNRNTGNRNTGDWNIGNRNTGNRNTGDWNTGDWNTGNLNTGDRNTGNRNTGDRNTGDRNTGDRNTGNRNTGDWNTGDWNTGNRNTGNRNTGNWNSGSHNSGFFNTNTPTVRMFNKDSGLTFDDIDFPSFLYFDITEWVEEPGASDEERVTRAKEIETMGGFLRTYEYKEAFKKAWDYASDEERLKVQRLPNFDSQIFFEISGIDIRNK